MRGPVREYSQNRQTDVALQLQSPLLKKALALWQGKCQGDHIPARRDFTPMELKPFMGRIALIDVEAEPLRYRFRLIGSIITEYLDRDVTGSYLDEVYDPEHLDLVTGSLKIAAESLKPVRAFGTTQHSPGRYFRIEALDTPLSDDGKTVNMILKFTDFS